MDEPEDFLAGLRGKRVVIDEVHRLQNPSELLKIAADHFPEVKIIATGSSTLGASRKFRDTLTGRKFSIWLTPMNWFDLRDFKNLNLKHRLFRGGLPPFFMADGIMQSEFQEWMDDYWSKDIQELFRLERRSSLQRFVELILARSGGIFEATRYTSECEVSRQTIVNYLRVLEATSVAHVIKPFSSHKPTEIVSAPKVYGFDTGFVCYYRGWQELRPEDIGLLWEHFLLNEMQSRLTGTEICYWRDKQGHEVDFVITRKGKSPAAVECKWNSDGFDPSNLKVFRKLYPRGENYVVAMDVTRSFRRQHDALSVQFLSIQNFIDKLT